LTRGGGFCTFAPAGVRIAFNISLTFPPHPFNQFVQKNTIDNQRVAKEGSKSVGLPFDVTTG
jgi:hypothetical protein